MISEGPGVVGACVQGGVWHGREMGDTCTGCEGERMYVSCVQVRLVLSRWWTCIDAVYYGMYKYEMMEAKRVYLGS